MPGAAMDDAACSLIFETLAATYPHACDPEPFFSSPFQVLVLTILSAQTTDKQVWALRGPLFDAYPTPAALAAADTAELEAIVRPTGYYHAKARHLIGAARKLVAEYGGEVPAAHGGPGTPPRGRPQDREHRPLPRVRPERRGCGRHPCPPARAADRPVGSRGSGGSRAGPDGLPPACDVGAGHGPADRARPGGLRRPAPALRGLPDPSGTAGTTGRRVAPLSIETAPAAGHWCRRSPLFPIGINQDTILDVLS